MIISLFVLSCMITWKSEAQDKLYTNAFPLKGCYTVGRAI